MSDQPEPPGPAPASRACRLVSSGLCALVALLLGLLVATRALRLRDAGLGVPVADTLVMAAGVALAGTLLVLLARSRRTGLPAAALVALAAAALGGGLLLPLGATAEEPLTDDDWLIGYALSRSDEAYSSSLTLTVYAELDLGGGALAVAVLGLLPVAGLLAVLPGRRFSPARRLRAVSLVAAAVAAGLVLRDASRALGLPGLLQWQGQQLNGAEAVKVVAAVWALAALLLSARALLRERIRLLAVALPWALLIGWGALLALADPPARICCYGYSAAAATSNPAHDYGVLLPALAVGLLPLAIEAGRRRAARSSST